MPTAIALARGVSHAVHGSGGLGVVPVHLNELAPRGMRATFPGLVYQLGNLIAAYNAVIQANIAARMVVERTPGLFIRPCRGRRHVVAVLLVLALAGPEKRDVRFGNQ